MENDIQRIGIGNAKYPALDAEVFISDNEIFTFDSTTITFDSTTETFDEIKL
jgi:hypothetical protein